MTLVDMVLSYKLKIIYNQFDIIPTFVNCYAIDDYDIGFMI